jgi:hypothetical protein
MNLRGIKSAKCRADPASQMEQMHLAKQKRFGASSEKSKYDQYNLFNEVEATADQRIMS